MSPLEAQELIITLACRQVGIDPSEITGSTRLLDDLGLDSLDIAEMLEELQARTGVRLSFEGEEEWNASLDEIAVLARRIAADQSDRGRTI